ncbi:MAG: hypothetical protein ABSH53_22180 [Holophaga sp.]|jgi:hypothetical protein
MNVDERMYLVTYQDPDQYREFGLYPGRNREEAIQACLNDPRQALSLRELAGQVLAKRITDHRFVGRGDHLSVERDIKAMQADFAANVLNALEGMLEARDVASLVRMYGSHIVREVCKRMAAGEETTRSDAAGTDTFESSDMVFDRIKFKVKCVRHDFDTPAQAELHIEVITQNAAPVCPLLASPQV